MVVTALFDFSAAALKRSAQEPRADEGEVIKLTQRDNKATTEVGFS